MDKIGIYKIVEIHNYFYIMITMGKMHSNSTHFKNEYLKHDPFVIKDCSFCLFFHVVFTMFLVR